MKQLKIFLWVFFIALIAIAGYFYRLHNQHYPTTDNAYVNTNVIHIASQVGGKVGNVWVRNNQTVKKGRPLFRLEQQPFLLEVTKARAQLQLAKQQVQSATDAVNVTEALIKQRQAELKNATQRFNRSMPLIQTGTLPKSTGDTVIAGLNVAKAGLIAAQQQYQQAVDQRGELHHNAQITGAKAALAQAVLNLQYSQVNAPVDGVITNFSMRHGDVIAAGQALFVFIESHQWWVDANYKETQLGRIKPGQTANILIDSYPHHPFHGNVDSISRGSGSAFSLLPPENATGNWIKVTQRFPVRIRITDPVANMPLRVGASAAVTIDTTK